MKTLLITFIELFIFAGSKAVDYSAVQADIVKALTNPKSFWPAGNKFFLCKNRKTA